MNNHSTPRDVTPSGPEHKRRAVDSGKPRSPLSRLGKNVALFLVIPLFVMLLGVALLLYVYQGQKFSGAAIDTRVQAALDNVLGNEFSSSIGSTGLSFISTSALALNGKNVRILHKSDGAEVATLENVDIGLNLLSVLKGKPQFDKLVIKGGSVDISKLSAPRAASKKLQQNLREIAILLSDAQDAFTKGATRSITVSDIEFSSLDLKRIKPDLVRLTKGKVTLDQDQQLNLVANLVSSKSDVDLIAKWRANEEGGSQLSVGVGDINTEEWFESGDISPDHKRGIGLSMLARVDARIPFDAAYNPLQPFAKIQAAGGKLRLGDKTNAEVSLVIANVKVSPDTGKIEIEPSQVNLGGREFAVSGFLSPIDPEIEFAGPVEAQLDVQSELPGSTKLQTVSANGVINAEQKQVSLDNLIVNNNGEQIAGYLGLEFSDTSPSLRGKLQSSSITVPSLLASWPFHIAPNVSKWMRENLSRGRFENLSMSFDVPKGRFASLSPESGFRRNELNITSRFSGMQIRMPGSLPSLQNVTGKIRLDGSRFGAAATSAILRSHARNEVKVSDAQLEINNVFEPGVPAVVYASLEGKVDTLVAVADSKPIELAKNLAVKPSDLSGSASVGLKLNFDLDRKKRSHPLKWQADVSLANAGSKSPVVGRKVSDANVRIKAHNSLVAIKGTAKVDGYDARLDIVEPIGGGDKDQRRQDISLQLTHKDLAKQGIDLGQVVRGKLSVKINSQKNGNPKYTIDLTEADVSLPWISFLKGKGIAASASFVLDQKDDQNTLSNFKFSGDGGLNAQGNIVFDRNGLIGANLKKVRLRGQDDFDVSVSRKGNHFTIKANGAAFEGRAIINQIIHKDGLRTGNSKTGVTLNANFGKLIGFEKRVMENALVVYQADGGRLSRLQVKGALNGKLSTIDAKRSGSSTTFKFVAKDAGASLAMVNIYTKMRGGSLKSTLTREGNGPFVGKVKLKNFVVVGEERLSSLVAAPVSDSKLKRASGKLKELDVRKVKFDRMEAIITKSKGYLGVKDGIIRNPQIGLTFDGVLYDTANKMNVRGTFMPLFIVSRLIGAIPIIGDLFSNGKDSGLIGITYRLKGAANNPQIAVNPISIIAPGIFRKIFEFQP